MKKGKELLKSKSDKLWAEHRSLSYTCYCDERGECRYCKRQREILREIESLEKGE